MRATGGLITEADLAAYQAKVVEPLVIPYRDTELVLLPYQAGGVTIGMPRSSPVWYCAMNSPTLVP